MPDVTIKTVSDLHKTVVVPVVLYVNDLGEARWEGPFKDHDEALAYQVKLARSGKGLGALTVMASEGWVKGVKQSLIRDGY